MLNRIEEIKEEYSKKSIEELRTISKNVANKYSSEACFAASELLMERDPSFDKVDRILLLQQKSEESLSKMERKVGCIYQFVIVWLILAAIGFVLGMLQAGR